MILKEIDIVDFKNIASANLKFSSGFNCFVGKNGSGKTNILDAIYHLSMCKSYFPLIDNQIIRYNAPFYVLQSTYNRNNEEINIYCGYKRGAKKIFKKNDKVYSRLSEHIGLLPLVMISPSDFSLVDGSSEERRRFLDSIISQINRDYLHHLIKYNKLITQRNSLLKTNIGHAIDPYMLETLNEQLSISGDFIQNERDLFLQKFVIIFQHYYKQLSLDREQVKLEYKPSIKSGGMLGALKECLDRDKILTYTTVGIHRDELSLKIDDYLIKKVGSQGQKKTYLVALKLAQYNLLSELSGVKPLLLLDDVFDKLDADRVGQIMSIVAGNNFGQIFITDTNRHNIVDLLHSMVQDFRLFIVDNGEIDIC